MKFGNWRKNYFRSKEPKMKKDKYCSKKRKKIKN